MRYRSRPAAYELSHGRWTTEGHLTFLLVHSDHRADLFDPFLFHIDVAKALPPAITRATPPNRRGRGGGGEGGGGKGGGRTRGESVAGDADGGDEAEQAAWHAVGGWWKTADGASSARGVGGRAHTAVGSSRAGASPTGRGGAGDYQGSHGRLKSLRLERIG